MNENIDMSYYTPESETWAVSLDGRYMTAIQNYLEADGIPPMGVAKIVENAAKTLSYCPDPGGSDQCQKTGIVIGKVQSGKTSNFISITALAFDNGYDIVVVLGGTKKPLVTQNRDRIKEYFDATKEVLVLDTTDFKDQLTAQKMHQFKKMGKKAAKAVADAFADFMQIESPSKLFKRFGAYTGKGFVLGFDKEIPLMGKTSKSAAKAVADAFRKNIGSLAPRPAAVDMAAQARTWVGHASSAMNASSVQAINKISQNKTVATTNYTQNIYAPKAPSRIELYRQTKNLFDYANAVG